MKSKKQPSQVIGWREWISLPELGIAEVKPKIDTGARSSSLHAAKIKTFERDGQTWVQFEVHPIQRKREPAVHCEAPVLEMRNVKSSNGHVSRRVVIRAEVELADLRWKIDLTLASRDQMGFRMLLGREAVRGRFLVDAGGSYLLGKRPRRASRPSKQREH